MRQTARHLLLLAAVLLVAACAGRWETDYEAGLDASSTIGWRVTDVVATVPAGATTTEMNTFAPSADIVWHGEEYGDRKAQVARIVEEGIRTGSAGLQGDRPVTIAALITQFHGVTPLSVAKAPAAVHKIAYSMQVFDSRTGEALTPSIPIRADLEALVGASAVTAAVQGRDQRFRITNHIAAVTAGFFGIGPDQRRRFVGLGR